MKDISENKEDISVRLSQVLEYKSISVKEFSEILGYKRPQSIYDFLNGKVKPSFEFFSRFGSSDRFKDIDITWLITGTGVMLIDKFFDVIDPNMPEKTRDYNTAVLHDIDSIFRSYTNLMAQGLITRETLPEFEKEMKAQIDAEVAKIFPSAESKQQLELLKTTHHTEFRSLGEGRFLIIAPLVTIPDSKRYANRCTDENFVHSLPVHAVTVERLYFAAYRSFVKKNKVVHDDFETIDEQGDIVFLKTEIEQTSTISGRKIENLSDRHLEILSPSSDLIIVVSEGVLFGRIAHDGLSNEAVAFTIMSDTTKTVETFRKTEINELFIVEIVTNY
jgi:hypothetical protein